MTTALYFGSAIAVLFLAQRVRRFPAFASLVLFLLPLLFTGRALLTGGIYGPVDLPYTQEPLASIAPSAGVDHASNPSISDVYSQFLPWNDALRRSVHRGRWPLWNPYELSGTPLAGAAQSAPYHPLTILGLLLPRAQVPAYAASMLFLLAAVSAFLLCLELTESPVAALFGAAAWMASTHIVFFAGTALANAVSLLPLVLLGARRIVEAPGRKSIALLTAALMLVVLSGHPESALHVVGLAVAYFAFEFVQFLRAHRPVPRLAVGRIVGSGLAAGFLSLLLAAVFVLPMLEAIRQSEEFLHRETVYVLKSATASQIGHRLAANFLPFLEGAPGIEERQHSPAVRHGWLATAYAGSLLFPLSLYALFRSRSRQTWFFAAAMVFGLGAAVGAPGITHLLSLIPGFNVAVNDRMVSFAALGMCVLAAIGLSDWLKDARTGSPAPWFSGIAVVILIAALSATSTIGPDFLRVGAARSILPLALAATAALTLSRRNAVALIFALLLIQRGAEARWMQPTLPASAFYPAFPGLEVMRAAEPFRIVALGTMLPPAIATHYGLEDVRGFQAMTFTRYRATYPLWCVPQPVWSNRVDRLDPPFLSLSNVRYAIVPPAMALPAGWSYRKSFAGYGIAENSRVLPRAFVPASIRSVRDGSASLSAVSGISDFGSEGVIESEPARPQQTNGPGVATVREEGSRLFIHASMQGPGWIIVSNCAWKGWRARSRGRAIAIVPGDHAFIAFHLPAGEHDVELFYRPQSFVAGAVISGITLLVLLLYSAIPSSVITFFMSAQTSFFAAGFRSR